MGHRMLSPWQTDVQQCTSACAIEEVIVDVMCRQLYQRTPMGKSTRRAVFFMEKRRRSEEEPARRTQTNERVPARIREEASEAPLRLKGKRRRDNATARHP